MRTLRVFVYRNLNNGLFSVRYRGRVIAHTTELKLLNCVFKVNEGGRQRVLKEKRKNVHAGVEGDLVLHNWVCDHLRLQVKYNPYKGGNFKAGRRIIRKAPAAHLHYGKVFIEGKP